MDCSIGSGDGVRRGGIGSDDQSCGGAGIGQVGFVAAMSRTERMTGMIVVSKVSGFRYELDMPGYVKAFETAWSMPLWCGLIWKYINLLWPAARENV